MRVSFPLWKPGGVLVTREDEDNPGVAACNPFRILIEAGEGWGRRESEMGVAAERAVFQKWLKTKFRESRFCRYQFHRCGLLRAT